MWKFSSWFKQNKSSWHNAKGIAKAIVETKRKNFMSIDVLSAISNWCIYGEHKQHSLGISMEKTIPSNCSKANEKSTHLK